MLGQKSTFVSIIRCLVFAVLFLFNVESSGAQTTPAPLEKPADEIVAPVEVAPVSTNPEIAPAKTANEPVAVEPELIKSENVIEAGAAAEPPAMQAQCKRMLKADVVAVAQPIFLNRLGTVMPGGMVFALKRDTVGGQGTQLRADKRPRPIALRANVGDCIQITLTNNIPAANFKIWSG